MKNNLNNKEIEYQLENLPPIQPEKPVWNAGAIKTSNRKYKYAESFKKDVMNRGKSTKMLPSENQQQIQNALPPIDEVSRTDNNRSQLSHNLSLPNIAESSSSH